MKDLLTIEKDGMIERCSGWDGIVAKFNSIPPPGAYFDSEGDLSQTTWIFRGHKSITYHLEPTIERAVLHALVALNI